jgi:exopolysaccharide biosynthesis polyprenyl glycosylphosphotransferase
MTPQLAAMLTIHEPEAAEATAVAARHPFVTGGGAIAVPTRRLRPVASREPTQPARLRRESLYRRLLGAADALAATAALLVVLSLIGEDRLGVASLIATPLVVLVFKAAGLYDRDQLRLVHSTLDEVPVLVQLSGLYTLGVTILQPVLLGGAPGGDQIAALWLASGVAIVAGRAIARWLAGRALPLERCLVIGERRQAERIREKLASSSAHATVVATLPLAGDDPGPIGDPEDMRHIVGELDVHRIVIAPTGADHGGVADLIRVAKAADVQVSVLPRMFEVVGSAVELEDVDGLMMLGVRPFGLTRSSRLLKRVFDLVATAVGLLAVAPFIAVIAVAIRMDSRGPVFFRQVRVGRDGRHFQILKFRSMVAGAETQRDGLRALNEVGAGMFKISGDPRVTRVGRFLRRSSLDELPQLFNVMRGQMSLVGPRPLVTDEDAQVLGLDRSRLHLTPGMTGPWQVLGSRVPMREMVGIDYLYVANWSLWLDVKLLLRTVSHVLRRGNV